MLLQELYKKLEEKKEQMIENRRWLHAHPELSYEEKETSKFIAKFYEGKDAEVETGVGGTGIKVTIDSGNPGKTVAIRADFDALPITEETGLDYASQNKGVMHACGHDAHTAYMMALADSLIELKDQLKGKVVVIHQLGEEVPPGGASYMIKDGVLDGVDNIFGCHVMSQMETGNVYYHEGPTQQARAKFTVKIQGKGGHGAMPNEANDAIVAACHVVVALQTIVSRRLNPFDAGVVTIGSFGGEGTFNIIKDSVTIVGDVRCMSDDVQKLIGEQIETISKGVGAGFGCGVEVDFVPDYPVLDNDPEMTRLAVEAIKEAKIDEVKEVLDSGPQSPSEDFAYYTKIVPACFFYIGAKLDTGETFPHHHPKFQINEKAMTIAAKSMGAVVLKYMGLE